MKKLFHMFDVGDEIRCYLSKNMTITGKIIEKYPQSGEICIQSSNDNQKYYLSFNDLQNCNIIVS